MRRGCCHEKTPDHTMSMLYPVTLLVLLSHHLSREVEGFGFGGGGGGFKFRAPPLGPVSLMPVNESTHWADILEDTAQQALDHCKSVRLCNISGLFSFGDSDCSGCHPCSCDEGCYSRRDCCIDKQLRDLSDHLVLYPPPPLPPPRWSCHSTFVTHYDLASHVFMVDTCLENWKAGEEVRRCLTPPPNGTFSHWPVWSRGTSTVYRNVDCARCNKEPPQHLLPWNLKVACDRSVYLRHSHNVQESLKKALEEPTCQIFFVPPKTSTPFPCQPVKGRYIDTCNATGQRHSYDQTLWKACEAFHGEMTTAGNTYKNVFCAMCNQDRVRPAGMCEVDTPFPFFMEMDGASFRAQADHLKDSGGDSCGCPDSEVYDQFEGQCRPVQCSMTRQLHEGQCRSIVTNSSGIFYDLSLSLTPAHPEEPLQMSGTGPLTRVARNIRTAFLLQGSHTTGWHVMTHRFRVIAETEGGAAAHGSRRAPSHPQGRASSSQGLLRVLCFKVHIKFCSTWPEPSEALENRLFTMTTSEWSFAVDGWNKREFKASPVYIEGSQKEKKDKSFRFVTLLSSRGEIKDFVVDIPDSYIESHGGDLLETNYYLPISEALRCPRVSFNLSQENEFGEPLVVLNETSGTVHHTPSDKYVSFQYVEMGQDGDISVCADQLFDDGVPEVRPDFPVQFFSAQLFVTTISCQALSVFCLVLVLMTYVVFAELRTMAGKNLLGLVSTLTLAIALTGASVFGVGSSRGCQALGIAGHFFLLSAFTWGLIGLFHSYHLLHSTSQCRLERCLNEPRTFRRYVLVSLLVPAVMVAVTVVSNVLDSQGDCRTHLGYGTALCFLSSYSSFIVTLCASLLVILSSAGMSIWALREQRTIFPRDRSESFRQHFHHFMAQVFLTMVMAAAVVVQMVSVMRDSEALWYVSLMLHCGLALSVLAIFLCRRRTLKLWTAWFSASFVCGSGRSHGHKFSPVDT
ncbi:hypothetical protein ACOMHN_057755 [Nucella lapillus]